MKPLTLTIVTLILASAAFIGNVATASAAGSCSSSNFPAPTLNSGVNQSWSATCNVNYDVTMVLQYESGGTWHRATKNGGTPVGVTQGVWPAGHWQADWTFQSLDQTPYCAFNWRSSDQITNDATGDQLVNVLSPTLHKTC